MMVRRVLFTWMSSHNIDVDNEVFNDNKVQSYPVFFSLSVTHHPSIVSPAAVVLQGERHPDAGEQDDHHGQDEPQDEEEDRVVQIVRVLPVRSAAHPGGLWGEFSPAWQQWAFVYSEFLRSLPFPGRHLN